MSRIQILRLLIKLGPDAIKLFDFPGIRDNDKLRAWVNESLDLLGRVADLSETDADDAAVDMVAAIVANDAAWGGFCSILSLLEDKQDDEIELLTGAKPDTSDGLDIPTIIANVGEKAGIDPVLIITLLPYILQALRMFREWRKGRRR